MQLLKTKELKPVDYKNYTIHIEYHIDVYGATYEYIVTDKGDSALASNTIKSGSYNVDPFGTNIKKDYVVKEVKKEIDRF